jgi:hypothetical protein
MNKVTVFRGDKPMFARKLFIEESQIDRALCEIIGLRLEGKPAGVLSRVD